MKNSSKSLNNDGNNENGQIDDKRNSHSKWIQQPKIFSRRKGVINEGIHFEQLMILSTCLDLSANDEVQNFELSTNDENFKSFDDIVVSIQYTNGKVEKQAIQLKHKENEDKVLEIQDICGRHKKFNIARYCFETQSILNKNFTYIIHTNYRFDVDDQEVDLRFEIKKNVFIKFVAKLHKTGENIYKFELDESKNTDFDAEKLNGFQEFFQRFRLKANQDNLKKLYQKTFQKFKNDLGGSSSSFKKFEEFINKWCTRSQGVEKLNKNMVVVKIIEALLSPFVQRINQAIDDHWNQQISILRKAILKCNVTAFKTSNEFITKIWINQKDDEEIRKTGYKYCLLDDEQEKIEDSDCGKILWHLQEYPLIVKVDDESEKAINEATKLLAKNNISNRSLVLLCYSNGQPNHFQTLNDLKRIDENIYDEMVKEFYLFWRGNKYKLMQIVNSLNLEEILTTDHLLEIAKSKFSFGGKVKLPEHYVGRSLLKTVINFQFLKESTSNNSLVIISCHGEEDSLKSRISKVVDVKELSVFREDVPEEKIIAVHPRKCSPEEFREIAKHFPGKTCHHFTLTEDNLEWIESEGSIKELQLYRMKSVSFEDELELIQNFKKINIICSNPGLGKSTMLKYFNNSLDVKYWPLYIKCRNCASAIAENQNIKEFLWWFLKPKQLEKDLVDHFYKERRFIFLWDAVNEVSDGRKRNQLYQFIRNIEASGFKQCIVSRSNLKLELESNLNCFSRSIQDFNEAQQSKYITDRLSGKYNNSLTMILDKISKNIDLLDASHIILGVPIQLFILTELLLQNNIDNLNFSMLATTLYEHFVSAKLESFFKTTKIKDALVKEIMKEVHLNVYKILGFKACVNSVGRKDLYHKPEVYFMTKSLKKSIEALEKSDPVGFLVKSGENEVSFYHDTYAEYFAALFLSENLTILNTLADVFFKSRLSHVRFMLDLILCEEHPAHIAVLYKDLRSLKGNKEDILRNDLMGRTAIHVAISWAKEHLVLPGLTSKLFRMDDYLDNFKIMTFLLKCLFQLQEKSLDLSGSFMDLDYSKYILHLAVISEGLEIVEFVIENYASIDSLNDNNETPLMFAGFIGNWKMVEYLVTNGADINAANRNGWTCLYFAANRGHFEIFKYLFESGADYRNIDGQGRTLVHDDIINFEIIEYLIENRRQVNIFRKIPELADGDYIRRTFSAIMIDLEFAVKGKDDNLILVSCLGKVESFKSRIRGSEVFEEQGLIYFLNQVNKREFYPIHCIQPIIGIANQFTHNDFMMISKMTKMNCHHFVFFNDNLEWIESNGSIEELKQFQMETDCYCYELDVFKNLNSMNIITTEPGMGKSMTLKFFNQTSIKGYWPLYLNTSYQLRFNEENNNENLLLSLLKTDGQFDRDLLRILTRNRRIIFLWDDLRTILEDNRRESVYAFIEKIRGLGFVQWIASGNDLKAELEEGLSCFTRNIREFSREDQEQYINSRLPNKHLTKKITDNVEFLKTHCIFEVPLQLYIITELFLYEVEEIFPMTATALLSKFVRTKVLLEENLKLYELLAVKTCLGEEIAKTFGTIKTVKEADGLVINSNNKLYFTHYSYAEYFTALLLSKRYNIIPNFKEIYFDKKFVNIRFFLDFILGENCPLHKAVLCKDLAMLEKNSDQILTTDDGGRNAMHLAASMCKESFSLPEINILSKPSSPKTRGPLKIAIEILRYLKNFDNFNTQDELFHLDCFSYAQGYMLHIAIMTEDVDVVKFVSKCCKLYCTNPTPLMCAAFIGNFKIVNYLIESEDVNEVDLEGNTALHFSVFGATNLEVVKLLLEQKVDVNKENKHGIRALHIATCGCKDKVVELLLCNNAQTNCSDRYGWTPLMWAAKSGHLKITEMLLKSQVDVDLRWNGDVALHVAAKYNKSEVVQILVKNNPEVDYVYGKDGWTPLMLAAQRGNLRVAKILIDNKANVNMSKNDGCTALHVATLDNHLKIVKLLVNNKAEVNHSSKNGSTPLMYAAIKGFFQIAKFLIDNNSNINLSKNDGSTALHMAIWNSEIEVARLLIEKGGEVNASDQYERTPLMWAVEKRNLTLVKMLIDNGAVPKVSNIRGDTPFHSAVNSDQFEIAQNLIGNNSVHFDEVDHFKEISDTHNMAITDEGDTVLHLAVFHNKIEMVQYLIEKNVDVNSSENHGWTPLMLAAQEGHTKIVEMLIYNNAELNRRNKSGATALHIAAWNNQTEIARRLVEKNVEVDCFSTFRLTPLLIAVQSGNVELAKCLIDNHFAEINISDNFGFTPLMWATRKGYLKIAQYLLENNANIAAVNSQRFTAVHLAAISNRVKVVKFLVEQHGADLKNCVCQAGRTILTDAAIRGYTELVKFLIGKGMEIDYVLIDGHTALSMAVKNNQFEVAKLLIQEGAKVRNLKSKTGDTPLHDAVRHRNFELVKLLVEAGANVYVKNCKGRAPRDLYHITEEIARYLKSL